MDHSDRQSSTIIAEPNHQPWTVIVPTSRPSLIGEMILKAIIAAALFAMADYLWFYDDGYGVPMMLYVVLLSAGAYGFYESYKPWYWVRSRRPLLAASEDVLQVSNRRRKLDPPREVRWSHVSRIEYQMVAWSPFGDVGSGGLEANYISYVNFRLPISQCGRPLRIEISALDRPVHVLVAELRTKTGARSITSIDSQLLEDNFEVSARTWILFASLTGARDRGSAASAVVRELISMPADRPDQNTAAVF